MSSSVLSVSYDKQLHQQVLSKLQDNPALLQSLIDLADFKKTKHSIHDENRPCYEGNRCDQCDDCYSGDTEADHNDDMEDFFKQISKLIFPSDKDQGEEDNDSEEDSEDDDDLFAPSFLKSNPPQFPTISTPQLPIIPSGPPPKYQPVIEETYSSDISVEPFKNDLFREVKYGFIVNCEFKLFGVSSDKINLREPTQQEKQIALKMGLSV